MNERLRLSVQSIQKLPTLPEVAQEILKIIDSEETLVKELEEIISRDPAISAKIMSFSSSAFFGGASPPKSIKEAIVRVGFNNVKNITLGISLMTLLDDEKEHIFDYELIFKHSLNVAGMVTYLSKRLNINFPGNIYLAGLLHDLGYLVLNRYFSDDYKNVLAESLDLEKLISCERKVLGFTHGEIGHWLADKWKLPEMVGEVILHHHEPSNAKKFKREVSFIHIADCISANTQFYIMDGIQYFDIDDFVCDELLLKKEKLLEIEKELSDK